MPVAKVYDSTLGQWVDIGAGGLTNPMTTTGDIIYGGTSGAPTRLAKGADGDLLTLSSGVPAWASRDIDWANPVSVTTTATLAISKHHVCSGTSADYTVTLPAVSGNAGKLLSVEMAGALTKLVTLDGNASETIDGATSRVMWARESAILLCDGTQWTKVAGKSIPMACTIRANSAQAVAASTNTAVPLANFVAGLQTMHDTTNNRITILRSGNYLIGASSALDSMTAGKVMMVGFALNMTSSFSTPFCKTSYTDTVPYEAVSSVQPMTAGGYIVLMQYHADTVSRNTRTTFPSTLIVTEQPVW